MNVPAWFDVEMLIKMRQACEKMLGYYTHGETIPPHIRERKRCIFCDYAEEFYRCHPELFAAAHRCLPCPWILIYGKHCSVWYSAWVPHHEIVDGIDGICTARILLYRPFVETRITMLRVWIAEIDAAILADQIARQRDAREEEDIGQWAEGLTHDVSRLGD